MLHVINGDSGQYPQSDSPNTVGGSCVKTALKASFPEDFSVTDREIKVCELYVVAGWI